MLFILVTARATAACRKKAIGHHFEHDWPPGAMRLRQGPSRSLLLPLLLLLASNFLIFAVAFGEPCRVLRHRDKRSPEVYGGLCSY